MIKNDKGIIYTFPNGIRLLYQRIAESPISHCGFFINTGSRDEQTKEIGIAHFIEHMLFKGTKQRKSHHILNRMDNVGGELNAYTTKEKTCIYSSFPSQYLERAVELICDITFHSIFPSQELDKERNVILDEITMYKDNPEESLYDDFLAYFYSGNTLGNNILGTPESLSKIKHTDLNNFVKRNYHNNEMVFSVVSSLEYDIVFKIVNRYIEQSPYKQGELKRVKPTKIKPFNTEIRKDLNQCYCLMGGASYHTNHKNRYKIVLMNNILGGPAMNSRLNMGIREKYGFCYSIYSDLQTFVDSGLMTISFGTDFKNFEKCYGLVLKELNRLKHNKISDSQLTVWKRQFVGQMLMAEENKSSVMSAISNALLDSNKVATFGEVVQHIENTTALDIMEMANQIWSDQNFSVLTYMPDEN